MATPDETQAEFEARVFGHYGCADCVGNWEILVYVMLLEHAPDLISDEDGPKGGAKRGRKQQYTPEWGAAVNAEIRRVMMAPDAPPGLRTRPGALRHLFRSPEWRKRYRCEKTTPTSLLKRLGEVMRLGATPPGKPAA